MARRNARVRASYRAGRRSSVVLDLNGLDERVAEIDESLCRQQLNKLEESEQLAERKQIYERKYPEKRRGRGSVRRPAHRYQ